MKRILKNDQIWTKIIFLNKRLKEPNKEGRKKKEGNLPNPLPSFSFFRPLLSYKKDERKKKKEEVLEGVVSLLYLPSIKANNFFIWKQNSNIITFTWSMVLLWIINPVIISNIRFYFEQQCSSVTLNEKWHILLALHNFFILGGEGFPVSITNWKFSQTHIHFISSAKFVYSSQRGMGGTSSGDSLLEVIKKVVLKANS